MGGRRASWRLALQLTCLAYAGQQASAAAIRFPLEAGAVVGRNGLGALCFPRRAIRWDRGFRPDTEEIDHIVAAAFGALTPGIRGEVLKIELDLCQPHWGPLAKMVGEPTALKGEAVVEIRWTLTPTAGCTAAAGDQIVHTRFAVSTDMRGGVPAVISNAVAANARQASTLFSRSSGGCPPP